MQRKRGVGAGQVTGAVPRRTRRRREHGTQPTFFETSATKGRDGGTTTLTAAVTNAIVGERPAEKATRGDAELVEALRRRGDERAFRELYRRHTPRLYQLVLRLVGGSESDAEDVVQETWLRATSSLDRFRWESAFSTWLTGIGLARASQLQAERLQASRDSIGRAVTALTGLYATTAAAEQRVRYSGTFGNTDIEVRSVIPMVVTETPTEVIIRAGETVVTLKRPRQ